MNHSKTGSIFSSVLVSALLVSCGGSSPSDGTPTLSSISSQSTNQGSFDVYLLCKLAYPALSIGLLYETVRIEVKICKTSADWFAGFNYS